MPENGAAAPYEWGVAERTLAGEHESGDRWVVAPRAGGILFAVVDGLGHGPLAATAARAALDTLAAHVEDDLPVLVQRTHRALQRSRGAVMALAVLRDGGVLRWASVGNVEAVVVRNDGRRRQHAVQLAGVLGMRIPEVRPAELELDPGDEVVLATDGISRDFADDLAAGAPQRTADDILRRYATGRDDALVLVVRYQGQRR